MSYDTYHKRKIGKHVLKPATQMLGFGYDPTLSGLVYSRFNNPNLEVLEGAYKP